MLSFVLAAALGVPDAGFAALPPAQEFLIAPEPCPAGSGPSEVVPVAPAPERSWIGIPAPPADSSALVDAHVFEKYRSFRESLSTP